MQIVRTPLAPTGAELAQAAVVGVVTGAVSAGLRWALFRLGAKRRHARMKVAIDSATQSFGEALGQATEVLGRMTSAAGGKVTPPDISGQIRVAGPFRTSLTDEGAEGFRVDQDQLDKIFADLNRARRGGESPQA